MPPEMQPDAYARKHVSDPLPPSTITILKMLVRDHGSPSHAMAWALAEIERLNRDVSDAARLVLELRAELDRARALKGTDA